MSVCVCVHVYHLLIYFTSTFLSPVVWPEPLHVQHDNTEELLTVKTYYCQLVLVQCFGLVLNWSYLEFGNLPLISQIMYVYFVLSDFALTSFHCIIVVCMIDACMQGQVHHRSVHVHYIAVYTCDCCLAKFAC